ncbi:MAG: hypothetical protein CMM50_05850 [Rhodospirillaceae bacterium]|nr:hypothetical protein [Rhodospirillaceae bacterium]
MTAPANASVRWVVLHHVEHVRAVSECLSVEGDAVDCITAPGAAAYAGVGYLKKMVTAGSAGRGQVLDVVLDCGDDAGLVLGAVREEWSRIAFAGEPEVAEKLRAIASAKGCVLLPPPPLAGRLDLRDAAEPRVALRDWLVR